MFCCIGMCWIRLFLGGGAMETSSPWPGGTRRSVCFWTGVTLGSLAVGVTCHRHTWAAGLQQRAVRRGKSEPEIF